MLTEDRYRELKAEYDAMGKGASYERAARLANGIDFERRVGFENLNYDWDEGNEIFKAIYNGAIVTLGRGIVGMLRMAHYRGEEDALQVDEADETLHKRIDETANAAMHKELDEIAKSSKLQRYNIYGATPMRQFALDLTEAGAQMLPQLALTAATGGAGMAAGGALMFTEIAGGQYLDLLEQGVTPERAANAALANAAVQSVLEQLPMAKILEKTPAGAGAKKKLIETLSAIIAEGGTEFMQEFPEQLSNIYALHPELNSVGDIAKKWKENAQEHLEEALYSGLLGGALGGISKNAVQFLYKLDDMAKKKFQETQVNNLGEKIKEAKKSGLPPEEVADAVDEARAAHNIIGKVNASSGPFFQFALEKGIEEVSEITGVDIDTMEQATAIGDSVEMTVGHYVAAGMKYDDFHSRMAGNISFSVDSHSAIVEKMIEEGLAENKVVLNDQDAKWEKEIAPIRESARSARITKKHWSQIESMLYAHASILNPSDPAEWLKKHPIEFVRIVHTPNGSYPQYKGDLTKGKALGYITWDKSGKAFVNLLQGSDVSTVVHEVGHYFIKTLEQDVYNGLASEQNINDFEILLKYVGFTKEQWEKLNSDLGNKENKKAVELAHEKLAEAFESYLIEGEAPSNSLRKVFAKIRDWLLAIYEHRLRNPNEIPLTNEVREVFDRMLASKEEIEFAKMNKGFFKEVPSEITSKLKTASLIKLREYIDTAEQVAIKNLMSKNLTALRKNYKEAKEKFKKNIEGNVREEIASRPLYAASSELCKKIAHGNYKRPTTIAGKYINAKESKDNSLNEADTQQFEIIAGEFGEFSGPGGPRILADKIKSEPSFEEAVRREIAFRSQEKFPDIMRDLKERKAAILESIYSEQYVDLINMERNLINQKASDLLAAQNSRERKKAERQLLRKPAWKLIESLPITKAIKIGYFATKEREAEAYALHALRNKDWKSYEEYKYRQSIWATAAELSAVAHRKYIALKKGIRKFSKTKKGYWGSKGDKEGKIGAYTYYIQAGKILERLGPSYELPEYELVRSAINDSERPIETLKSFAEKMTNENGEPGIAEWLYDNGEGPFKNENVLTLPQLEDIFNALRCIKTIADNQEKQYASDKKGTWDKFEKELDAELDSRESLASPEPGIRTRLTSILTRAKNSLLTFDTLVLALDGFKENGFFRTHFFNPLKHQTDKASKDINTYMVKKKQALNKLALKVSKTGDVKNGIKKLKEKRAYVELGVDSRGRQICIDWLVFAQIIINYGNEENRIRLADTPPIGLERSKLWVRPKKLWVRPNEFIEIGKRDARQQTIENLKKFIEKYATPELIQYAQSIIEISNRNWDKLVKLEIRTKGYPPKKVTASPTIFNLKNGGEYIFQGGYYPLVRDGRKLGSTVGDGGLILPEDARWGEMTMLTNRNRAKPRSKSAKYPVDISPDAGERSVVEGIRDIYLRETMQFFNRVFVTNNKTAALLQEKLGTDVFNLIKETFRNTAWPGRTLDNSYAENTIASVVGWLRRKTIHYLIVCNLKPIVQNFENIFYYGGVIKGFTHLDTISVLGEMLRCIKPGYYNELLERVTKKSSFMEDRAQIPDISINDVLTDKHLNWIEQNSSKLYSKLMVMSDMMTALPVWERAYHKKYDEYKAKIGEMPGETLGEKEKAVERIAVDFADAVVRRGIGSSRLNEVAPFQRMTGAYRLFTMFQQFFVTQFNQWYREVNIDWRLLKQKQYATAINRFAMFATMRAIIISAINVAAENFFYGDDDDEEKSFMRDVFAETLATPLNTVPIGGPLATNFISRAMGWKTYCYRLTPAEKATDLVLDVPTKFRLAWEDELDPQDAFEALFDTASFFGGVPHNAKVGWNVYDMAANDMSPRLGDLFRRRPKSQRE